MGDNGLHDCRWCKHLNPEEDGSFGESRYFWYECAVTNYDNIGPFPFKNTKCRKFKKRNVYVKPRNLEEFKKIWKDQ